MTWALDQQTHDNSCRYISLGISFVYITTTNEHKHSIMIKAAVLLIALGMALAAPDYPQQQQSSGMPYDFGYGVKDEYRGVEFDHSEDSDGDVVRGSYSVVLPDGRTQIVTYEADAEGYRANVEYIGEAQFPSKSGPAVTFKPQPQNSYQQEDSSSNSYQPPQQQSSYQPPQQQQSSGYGR